MTTEDCHYAIVSIGRQLFAITARAIREMVVMPEIAKVPDSPLHIRGVSTLRGSVVPIIDTRIRLGRSSASEEIEAFCALMRQREQDHVAWLEELYNSVVEGREFKLTLDPHKCAFGKWYDSYRSDDTLIAALLKKFDAPHKRIHAIGTAVAEHLANHDGDAAKLLIEGERTTTLCEMRNLFDSLRTLIREQQREMAIVLTNGVKTFGAAVDGLVSVERLRSGDIGPLPPGMEHGGMVSGLAKREKNDGLLLILDVGRLSDCSAWDAPHVAMAGISS